jgi:hypothetical protein
MSSDRDALKAELRSRSEARRARQRDLALRRKYGISESQYLARLEAQGHRCAICGWDWRDAEEPRRLVVDHDHRTGKVRGLLCGGCNTGLGDARDFRELVGAANPDWPRARVEAACAYLEVSGARAATGKDIVAWRKSRGIVRG